MDSLANLLGRSGFLPHGYCFTWSPGLLWSMVIADTLIAAAYFSIPLAILHYVRRRPQIGTRWVPWLFSAFIFACGLTHVMDIWTIWYPDYALQAMSKVVTAAISLVTAVALWPLLPRAVKIPSVQELRAVIGRLEAEVLKRRTAEEQLADIQQNLAVTLASIDAGFISTDREGRVTHINAVAGHITGWPGTEALGQPLWQVFQREGRPVEYLQRNPVDVMLELDATLDTAHHVVALSRSGAATPVEVKAALTRDGDGRVSGLAMVVRDRTREIQAAQDSRRLAAIVESSFDAIIGETLDGVITSWNGGAEQLYGFTAAEAIGRPMEIVIPPDRAGEETALLARLAAGEQLPTFETLRRAKDGRMLEVSLTISPIRDEDGRIVGAAKIARNITERRRAAAALRDSESLLRTLHTHYIVSIADREGRITGVNDSFCAIAGYSREELIGQTHRLVNAGVHDAAFWRDLWSTIAAGRPWRGQICNRARDGSLHWLDSVIAPFVGDDGRIEKYIAIRTDVTAAKRAEGARLEALRLEAENRQIREASVLKSQFLANMSHELRTPLNAIIGFADLMHSGYVRPDSPKHHEYLGHIGTSGRHLLQLINDVLDLSKVESGRFDFHPEPVDLRQVLKEVQDILMTSIQRKGLLLEAEVEAGLDDLHLDPSRLKQVLYNYLSNAIKFTPPHGRVTVRALAQGPAHWRLEVEDTGIGISAEDLPRLFTEFQQLDTGYAKQFQGTGLGLALTRRLVRAQGGEVGVRSVTGQGSVFHVVLNRRHGHDRPRPDDAASRAPGHDRVLVIESGAGMGAAIAQGLSSAGFAVDTASSGVAAVQRARATPYAGLTLGLRLPDEPGLGVLAGIRDGGESRGAPVIGVTMAASLDRSAAFAIADVLSKPIRGNEVRQAMAGLRRPAADDGTEGRAPERRPRVMVVDDEASSLELMAATLRGIGIEPLLFGDGPSALAALDEARPDALVLDLMMPGFDGFQVLHELQGRPSARSLPVFIWTSMLLTDDEYETLARSAQAILVKGGGAMEVMLASLARWRGRVVPEGEGERR